MTIKEQIFKTEDGKVDILVKQLSFAGQMRLQKIKDRDIFDIYKECVNKPELLELLDREEGLKLSKVINELNGWDKKSDEIDFQKSA